jgi:hypothetical protein
MDNSPKTSPNGNFRSAPSVLPIAVITANVGTEGAVKIFLFWDVFKELLVTQPVLH